MSVRIPTRFVIVPHWILFSASSRAVQLYAILWTYADRQDHTCYPSRTTLAEQAKCSVDTIDRTMKELVSIEAVTIEKRIGEDGASESNIYTLSILPPPSRIVEATPRRTDEATPRRMDAALTRPTVEQEPNEQEGKDSLRSSLPATTRKKNDLWEALAEIWGAPQPDTPMHGKFVKATALYRSAGITPDQIGRVHDLYKSTRDSAYTIMAVANNAQELLAEYARPAPVSPLRNGRASPRDNVSISLENIRRVGDMIRQRENIYEVR